MKQYIKETRFYHHTFLFFYVRWLVFHYHYAKKFKKLPKKLFQFLGWMRKNFIPGNFSWRVSAEYRTYLMHFSNISNVYKLFQKYSLNWFYAVLIFTSKLRDPPPQQNYPSPTKIKISDPPQQTLFWNF